MPESLPKTNINEEALSRKEMRERLIRFFDKTDMFEKFQDLLRSESLEDKIAFDEFKNFLIRINGILRDINIKDREFDGKDIILHGFNEDYEVPDDKDKESLLLKTYEAIFNIKDKNDLQYLIPVAINAIHLFADGNGRTSRVMHLLLKNLCTKEEFYFELDKALGINGRFDSVDINPLIVYEDIEYINALKKERVEILIDSFIDPENYKTIEGDETIKDKLIESVHR